MEADAPAAGIGKGLRVMSPIGEVRVDTATTEQLRELCNDFIISTMHPVSPANLFKRGGTSVPKTDAEMRRDLYAEHAKHAVYPVAR